MLPKMLIIIKTTLFAQKYLIFVVQTEKSSNNYNKNNFKLYNKTSGVSRETKSTFI